MSDKIAAVLLSFGLLGGMFLWVPLLEMVCPPCSRFLRARRRVRHPKVVQDSDVSRATRAA